MFGFAIDDSFGRVLAKDAKPKEEPKKAIAWTKGVRVDSLTLHSGVWRLGN